MRTRTRGVLSAVLALSTVLGVGSAAQADRHKPVPTQAQVDHAQAVAAQKAGDVAALQASLAVANARLRAAADQAEVAAEAYNGAMWQLQQAQQATGSRGTLRSAPPPSRHAPLPLTPFTVCALGYALLAAATWHPCECFEYNVLALSHQRVELGTVLEGKALLDAADFCGEQRCGSHGLEDKAAW